MTEADVIHLTRVASIEPSKWLTSKGSSHGIFKIPMQLLSLPRLRDIILVGVPFPGPSQLLASTIDLVSLRRLEVSEAGYNL